MARWQQSPTASRTADRGKGLDFGCVYAMRGGGEARTIVRDYRAAVLGVQEFYRSPARLLQSTDGDLWMFFTQLKQLTMVWPPAHLSPDEAQGRGVPREHWEGNNVATKQCVRLLKDAEYHRTCGNADTT